MKKYAALLLVYMMIVMMLLGCQSAEAPIGTEPSAPIEQTQQTEETEEPNVTEATEVTEAPTQPQLKGIVVATKFGKLYYQDQWEEFMRIAQVEEGNNVTVSFAAEIGDNRYPLFNVIIGRGEGEPVGQITDDQGMQRNVFVYMEDIVGIEELPEGEQNRLFAMQEDINFVIENLE